MTPFTSFGIIMFMLFVFLSFIFMLIGLLMIYFELIYFIEFEVLSSNSLSVVMTFLFDWMSCFFISFVLMISGLVIFYSVDYMSEDKFMNRFIMLVLMFVISMGMLITSPNLISMLLGWDGLGLISYCLVIYFQNVKSFNAGMLTALSNRVGDVALLMGIAWMMNYGSWSFIYYLDFMKVDSLMTIVSFFVVLAAMTKSAQIPFSSWLPAAMAAPTPVSALVHSSTLVTAGVYLLIRFNLLMLDSSVGQFLLLFSGLTMLMSGLGANFEFDLKKIIALSTLSQLGLMMMILSMGFPKLAFFHLLTHAVFKALLFMCAGSIIHSLSNCQDIRMMGGLVINMPLTITFFNIANLALCGMPFLSGFYSKDLIIEVSSFYYINYLIFVIYYFSVGLTVSYSFRLIYYTVVNDFNVACCHNLSESISLMLVSKFILVFFSLIMGSILSWLMFPTPYFILLPFFKKQLTLLACFLGGAFGYGISLSGLYTVNKSFLLSSFVLFFMNMWFLPLIFSFYLINKLFNMGLLMKVLDQGWSEYFGAMNIFNYIKSFSVFYQLMYFNTIKLYMMGFFLCLTFFIIFSFLL